MEIAILSKGISQLKINDKSGKLSEKLKLYIKEIKMFDKAFNLVNYKNDEDLVISHILDSLSPWYFFDIEIKDFYKNSNNLEEEYLVADIGSGAGLPGLPLASLYMQINNQFPKLKFLLVERMSKRCSFLNNQKALLNLLNTNILNIELEKINTNKFNIVTCRAFKPLEENILNALFNCLKDGGKLFLYKGTSQKIQEDVSLIERKKLNYKIEKLTVPFLEKERHLLIIEK